MKSTTPPLLFGILASLTIAISGFLPWAHIGILYVDTTVYGTGEVDGWVIVGLGVLSLILLFTKPKLVLIPAIFALGFALFEWLDFYRAYVNNEDIMDKGLSVRAGIGLYLLPAGAVLLGLTSFFIKDNRE